MKMKNNWRQWLRGWTAFAVYVGYLMQRVIAAHSEADQPSGDGSYPDVASG
ncbi:MAG: hypothetical protein JOZ29_20520 [Deltaproteobacteria bacterium]|nr:hypothetical protein [Deltaproteobacteria bacterium]